MREEDVRGYWDELEGCVSDRLGEEGPSRWEERVVEEAVRVDEDDDAEELLFVAGFEEVLRESECAGRITEEDGCE